MTLSVAGDDTGLHNPGGILRNLTTVILLAATVATTAAQSPPPTPPAEIVIDGRVDVPMILVGTLPIVEVRINGQGPFRFGIETGAGFIVVSPTLAAKLSLARTGGPDEAPQYRLDAMAVGGATFKGVVVSALRTAQTEIDGVLGLPFYRDLLLTLDYPGQKVSFERGGLPEPDGQRILPLTKVGPFWGMPITFAGVPLTAVVDTRSTGAFGVVPSIAEKLSFDGPLTVVGRARGAAIPETEVKAGRLSGPVTIGAYSFVDPVVNVRALPPGFPDEPIVGTRVLSQFVVTLDQKNARIRLEKSGETTITLPVPQPMAMPSSGAAPSVGDGKAYVGTYGVRQVRLEGEVLILQRDGGPALRLVRKSGDEFTLAEVPTANIRFTRDAAGVVTELHVQNPQGAWETAKRGTGPDPATSF